MSESVYELVEKTVRRFGWTCPLRSLPSWLRSVTSQPAGSCQPGVGTSAAEEGGHNHP